MRVYATGMTPVTTHPLFFAGAPIVSGGRIGSVLQGDGVILQHRSTVRLRMCQDFTVPRSRPFSRRWPVHTPISGPVTMTAAKPTTDTRLTSLVARQPIYRRDLSVYGYELLFRNPQEERQTTFDGNLATSSVLLTAFVDIGLSKLVGRHRAFVNFPRDFLTGKQPIPDASGQLVIEILEDIQIDTELIAGISDLKSRGYLIALDDVVYSEMLIPIMHLVDIVKVDYPEIPSGDIQSHVDRFRQWPVKLLAEKVETRSQYEECREAGFDMFQGFFLSRPELMESAVTKRQSGLLPLLVKLQSTEATFEEMEEMVGSDADLCFRMMRYLDSSIVGLTREIQSMRHGLVLLGMNGVRRLIALLALKRAEGTPSEVLVTSLVRASMCQRLALAQDRYLGDAAYTTGLFSQLDKILGRPMYEVLTLIPLKREIHSAILDREGRLGQLLRTAIAYETADWKSVDLNRYSTELLTESYLEAVRLADGLIYETGVPADASSS